VGEVVLLKKKKPTHTAENWGVEKWVFKPVCGEVGLLIKRTAVGRVTVIACQMTKSNQKRKTKNK
jgi:hypothetical protein